MTAITEIGLVSALGTDAFTSLAAARAGLSRLMELRTVNPASEDFLNGAPVTGHTAPCGIAAGFVGPAKAILLGRAALADLLSRRDPSTVGRIGVYLALSDCFILDGTVPAEGDGDDEVVPPSLTWRAATRDFLPRLVEATSLAPIARQHIEYGGHAAVVQALAQAHDDLMRDRVDFCVVGGIDSRVEPRVLRAAARAGMLKTADVATGFLPGEAGAFFALERQGAGGGAAPSIAIHALATAHDAHHALADEPPDGAGLAAAVQDCLAQLDPETQARIGLIVCDLNGEERRAIDWGYCLVRLQSRYRLGDRPLWLPAASFGDAGCASGALAICMAARGLQRGYAGTSAIAVVLSSDSGGRGAVCLTIS